MVIRSDGVVVFYGLLILLILVPLPFGSVLPWAQSFLTFGVFALLVAWAVNHYSNPFVQSQSKDHQDSFQQSDKSASRGLYGLLIVWSLASAFAFFQVVPLPPTIIAVISPTLHELYGWTLPGYGPQGIWRSLSTTPASTVQSGLLIG